MNTSTAPSLFDFGDRLGGGDRFGGGREFGSFSGHEIVIMEEFRRVKTAGKMSNRRSARNNTRNREADGETDDYMNEK